MNRNPGNGSPCVVNHNLPDKCVNQLRIMKNGINRRQELFANVSHFPKWQTCLRVIFVAYDFTVSKTNCNFEKKNHIPFK